MNIFVGWPGSCHYARILANSAVFAKGEAGDLVPDTKQHISGMDVSVVILGDPAYPVLPWLMKPYTATGPLIRDQRRLNYQLSRARVFVECTFGRLKGRWRSLMKRNDTDVSFMPTLISACCVLHNLCELHDDGFDDDWLCEEEATAGATIAATATTPFTSVSATAESIRKAL